MLHRQGERRDGQERQRGILRWTGLTVAGTASDACETNVMLTDRTLLQTIALVALCGWVSSSSLLLAQAPAAAPGPDHARLEVFVGEWSFEGQSQAVPALGMADAGTVAYRHVNQMANGGFFLETRRTGTGPRGPVTELDVYSYNAVTKTYRQDGYDNRGRVRTFTGTVDGLTWSFIGTNTALDGTVTQERFTLRYSPDLRTATVRSEHSKDGVTWYERLTGTYTKVSGAATAISRP